MSALHSDGACDRESHGRAFRLPVPGLTVVLDKTQVGPNGDATVKIACQPCIPTEPVTVNLTVEPFGCRFPVSPWYSIKRRLVRTAMRPSRLHVSPAFRRSL